MRSTVLVLGVTLASCATPPSAPPLPSGVELRQRTIDLLVKAASLQWTVSLEVEEDENDFYLRAYPEHQTWRFKVKGASKAAWSSEEDGDFFYEEPTLTIRTGGELTKRDFGKEEGACVVNSVVKGGLVGWHLVHACWGFEYDRLSNTAWDQVDGRRAIVADADFKLASPGSTDPEFKGGRLWIDAETGLPLQRTYAFLARDGAAPKRFRARERYSNWKVDAPVPDSAFRP